MNILIVSHHDWSGSNFLTAQAVNKHTEYEARVIAYENTYTDYPTDILAPTPEQLSEWIHWADILCLCDGAAIDGYRKPVLKIYRGTYYRQKWRELNEYDKSRGYHQICRTIDLSLFGPRWIPRPMSLLSGHKPDKRTFRVCHAPTGRDKKGTDIVEAALGDLDGITLEIIEGVSNEECLTRKAKAHVLVDQMPNDNVAIGYGNNALEAWAYGIPVVSYAQPQYRMAIENRVGYLPFIEACDTDTLAAQVIRLKEDADHYRKWAEIGRRYVVDFHAPKIVATRFIKVCENAI